MLDSVLPFAIVNFLIIGAGIAILALASWLGAVLFEIPAKDSLTSYTPPIIVLSLGITLVGSFLNHKLPTNQRRRRRPSPIKPLAPAPISDSIQFTHVLVPGGKEAEDTAEPSQEEESVLTATAPTPREHYEDMGEKNTYSWSTSTWGSRRNDRPPLTGPPDKVQPRIDAISFNCQECKGTLSLPAEKAKTILNRQELEIDCPHCGQHYPFDYDLAQRKTLTVTFRGLIGEEWEDKRQEIKHSEPTPGQDQIPTFEPFEAKLPEAPVSSKIATLEPTKDLDGAAPSGKGLLASFYENPVGEAAKAIKTSSKALVGSLLNTRIFQTVASRLQLGTASSMVDFPSPGQFKHMLVPGGKEGESLTEIIPTASAKWAPPTLNDPLDPTHGTFEDMSDWESSTRPPIERSTPVRIGEEPVAIPDRLAVEIEGFTFNCNACDRPIQLPWTTVQAGPETPLFTADCSSCRHQFTFNYGQARRKTLNLRLKPYFELANFEGVRGLAPKSVLQVTPQAVAKVEGRPVALAVMTPARYSPGREYDKAILEKG